MKTVQNASALVATVTIGVSALALIAIGPPLSRKHAPQPVHSDRGSSGISVNSFTLVSDAIEMPMETDMYPGGESAAVVNANCTSCHSPSMALLQPDLRPKKWEEIVHKMRDVYKAPIADSDIPRIVQYFTEDSAE
ncbi:hypothetical protein [Sphingobium sp. SA916]|uniref:hypothetical protein n=1 Tax=Sphingobium sp. SA916 TaxID=1851207 RepID=UPI0011AF4D27|nr:hypothetical protein [Sphingobium sp. SA916]